MKNAVLSFLALLSIPAFVQAESAAPQVTVLANSIDLSLSQGYVDTLKALGFSVVAISAAELPSHQGDTLILVLGGHRAPEGVGKVVDSILTAAEKEEILSSASSKVLVVLPGVWSQKQRVMVFAGYGKEQTRKLFGEAQGDIIKSLKFNDSSYLENYTGTADAVPPLDAAQPFTEVDAYEAAAIIRDVAGVQVLDVRGAPFYSAGHIPGAVSLPERQFRESLSHLDRDGTYLLYCGGNSESISAGNILASLGYKKLYRLVDGYIAWRKAGYPRAR